MTICCDTCDHQSPEERYSDEDYWWEYHCNLADGRKIERDDAEQRPPWCPLSAHPASGATCRRCGGQATHESHAGGHDVVCRGCGAHGVVDHESESDAWLAWVKFNATTDRSTCSETDGNSTRPSDV